VRTRPAHRCLAQSRSVGRGPAGAWRGGQPPLPVRGDDPLSQVSLTQISPAQQTHRSTTHAGAKTASHRPMCRWPGCGWEAGGYLPAGAPTSTHMPRRLCGAGALVLAALLAGARAADVPVAVVGGLYFVLAVTSPPAGVFLVRARGGVGSRGGCFGGSAPPCRCEGTACWQGDLSPARPECLGA
jgi:hypothetical protein